MNAPAPELSPSEASAMLGISTKALRLYEERGLLHPARTMSGWRVYGLTQMQRARSVVALRRLGLSLSQIGSVLDGDREACRKALAAHRRSLERNLGEMAGALATIEDVVARLENGTMSSVDAIERTAGARPAISLQLP